MMRKLGEAAVASAVLISISISGTAFAQKYGGILKRYDPVISFLQEPTIGAECRSWGV